MIPAHLEKAILKGWATYEKYTHAMGMYSSLPIPEGKLVIIVDIKWHNFINPYKNDGAVTFKEFFKYSEYQMKVDGFQTVNYMLFRNTFKLFSTAPVAAAFANGVPMNNAGIVDGMNFMPDSPVLQDVYFVCNKFLRITIQRNVFVDTYPAVSYGVLDAKANQKAVPDGIGNVPTLKRLTMTSATPNSMQYTPPGDVDAGLAAGSARNRRGYIQDTDPLCQIYDPSTAGWTASMGLPYLTQPLVEFGIITINHADFDRLASM